MVNTSGSCLLCIISWTCRWPALRFDSNGNAVGICWCFLSLWECWSASHCFPWDVVWGPLSSHMSRSNAIQMSIRFPINGLGLESYLCVWGPLVPAHTKNSSWKCLQRTSFQWSMTFASFLSFSLHSSCNDCFKIRPFFFSLLIIISCVRLILTE